jgi:hypothetical protein
MSKAHANLAGWLFGPLWPKGGGRPDTPLGEVITGKCTNKVWNRPIRGVAVGVAATARVGRHPTGEGRGSVRVASEGEAGPQTARVVAQPGEPLVHGFASSPVAHGHGDFQDFEATSGAQHPKVGIRTAIGPAGGEDRQGTRSERLEAAGEVAEPVSDEGPDPPGKAQVAQPAGQGSGSLGPSPAGDHPVGTGQTIDQSWTGIGWVLAVPIEQQHLSGSPTVEAGKPFLHGLGVPGALLKLDLGTETTRYLRGFIGAFPVDNKDGVTGKTGPQRREQPRQAGCFIAGWHKNPGPLG